MKKLISILLLFSTFFFIFGCSRTLIEEDMELMYFGTTIEVNLYHYKNEDLSDIKTYITKTYLEYDKITNRYTDYSNTYGIYYLNENSGKEVTVDSKLIDIFEYVMEKSSVIKDDDSNPVFNIAVGNASNIYHPIFDEYDKEEIDDSIFPSDSVLSVNYPIDVSKIIINKEASTIFIPEGMSIDLGGIAKGYATEIIRKHLDELNIRYTIDAGESSIITSIGNPYKKNNEFKVGLKNPDSSSAFMTLLLNNGEAISTSGDYQKYFIYHGKRYSHILNPSTNLPYFTDIRSIAIITDDVAYGDILSTSLYIIGYDKAIQFIESNDDVEGIIYKNGGTIYVSDGLEDRVNKLN